MESWGLKAAGGFLAALLLTSIGLQLLGTVTPGAAVAGSELRRTGSPAGAAPGLQHHQRHRRHAAESKCPAGSRRFSSRPRCCRQCPAGHFMQTPCTSLGNDTACASCAPGTFLSHHNLERECRKCSECHAQASQVVVQNCTGTHDVVCGCGLGHYKHCMDPPCHEFTCQPCRPCQDRVTLQNCSAEKATRCGDCLPGFYLEGGECRECASRSPEKCGEGCGRACVGSGRGAGLEYILLGLMGPLFLGALFIYHRRRTLSAAPAAAGEAAVKGAMLRQAAACPSGAAEAQGLLHLRISEPPQTYGNACPVGPLGGQGAGESPPLRQDAPRPLPGALPQGSRLYDIINAVPVRRWKEFMRVLQLQDAEIEVVELEFAHVRDQQYEMLKRWCQQQSASLESVFAALERMELAGCAEELRQRLERGP
ncbi:tumor necrosis factor receptor superfamily member 25 [Pelodiscus sinensis]|uniref:tumor necrosis factor receptor superfamily member 25 n=1 Tax=Pelodiscus sinensis TaxID=13735 RepID=UPI003F6BFF1E